MIRITRRRKGSSDADQNFRDNRSRAFMLVVEDYQGLERMFEFEVVRVLRQLQG